MLAPKQVGKELSIANVTTSGALLTPGLSPVERHRALVFNQTTAGVSVTLPNPTDTSISFAMDVFNSGTADITVNGALVKASGASRIGWNSVSGSYEAIAAVSSPELLSGGNAFRPSNPSVDTIYFDDATSFPWAYGKVHFYDASQSQWREIGGAAASRAYELSGVNFTLDGQYENILVHTNTFSSVLTLPAVPNGNHVYRIFNGDRTANTLTVLGNGNNIYDTASSSSAASLVIPPDAYCTVFIFDDFANLWRAYTISPGGSAVEVATVAPSTVTAKAGDLWWNSSTLEFYILHDDGLGTKAWVSTSGAAANGDVIGPASSTDNAITRYDGTTGKLVQNSLVTISDTGDMAGGKDLDISGRGTQRVISIAANASGTYNIDASLGNIFRVFDNAPGSQNINIDIINPPATANVTQVITIILQLNSDTVTFANKIRFPNNQTLPIMTAGRDHMLTLMYFGGATGGHEWFCTSSVDYISLF